MRANMVGQAEYYRWSSVAAHCGLRDDAVLGNKDNWKNMLIVTENWSDWLAVEEESERLDVLRQHVEKGLPCGSESFVKTLSDKIGRVLEARAQGRPRKDDEKG